MRLARDNDCEKSQCDSALAQCTHRNCTRPAKTILETNNLCPPHFLAACYAKLDEITQLVDQKKLGAAELKTIRSVVTEYTGAAVSHALQSQEFNNKERAQLLDFVVSAAQILTRLRRSPRVSQQVPLRLLGDPLTSPRIEDTVTQTVSKYGAMFKCGYPFAKGEIMDIVRLDTGHTAIARVAWHKPMAPGHHNVAIEILNNANFWNWGWS